MDMFEKMLEMQLNLQIEKMGHDPRELEGEAREDFFRTMAYALEDEIHEAGQEISWKPWAKAQFFNREPYIKELVDANHFLLNLIIMGFPPGTTPTVMAQTFFEGYANKNAVNAQRQDEGYTGIKCPSCHREVEAAQRHALIHFDMSHIVRCPCGTFYNDATGVEENDPR